MRKLGLIVTLLFVMSLVPSRTTTARFQDDSNPDPDSVVNVELILDVSGSMAQVIDTGETRMEAAKRVLGDVIAAIPDREGINVGLRIYGHEGNNTEAGRAESCKSSELVVDLEGLDSAAVVGELEQLQPTGWTPLAASLEQADEDFPEADDNVTNAVILVTDGLETCGGDPCTAAGDLQAGNSAVVTNVIGFALTADEQAVLSCISEEGGGSLFGAANAVELSGALFEVLEQLDVVVGGGYVGGNAFALLPAGESGEFAVVAVGPYDQDRGTLPFVVNNNTGEDAIGLKVSVTARDSGGNLVGAADALQVSPNFVRAGGVAFGYVYFGDAELPADAEFDFNVESTSKEDARFDSRVDLNVVEAATFEDRIVGTAENGFDDTVEGPYQSTVVCFDLDGNLLASEIGFSDTGDLDAGESTSFQIDLFSLNYRGLGCPAFLVAASGRGESGTAARQLQGSTGSESQRAAGAANATAEVGDSSTDADKEATQTEELDLSEVEPIPGLQDAAARSFEAPADGSSGTFSMNFIVLQFEDEAAADDAIEEVVVHYLDLQELKNDVAPSLKPTRAPDMGDRAIAYEWQINTEALAVNLAMLVFSKGDLVYYMTAGGFDVDPLIDLEAVAKSMVSGDERPTADDNLRSGALWDLLPTLNELPEGFKVRDELVPQMFGPLEDKGSN
jgi:hypothetical protein